MERIRTLRRQRGGGPPGRWWAALGSAVVVFGLGRAAAELRPASPLDLPESPPTGTELALVAEVTDGDTLRLADGRRVRLLGIDAPETVHPGIRSPQSFGSEASERLKVLVEHRRVGLERDRTDRDAYGRLLRHVWIGRSLVGAILLAEGLAWPLGIPPDLGHAALLEQSASAARSARRGVWGQSRPTPLAVFLQPQWPVPAGGRP